MINPEAFVKDQFPASHWPTIPTILRSAYTAADNLIKEQPILGVASAQDNKSRLISWAVDFGMERAIKNGSIDCDYCWRDFDKPTGRYLEMRFKHSTASISNVKSPDRQPRPVSFRENARLRTQSVFDFAEFEKESEIRGLPHFLLIHGHQSLQFAHLGVPSTFSQAEFVWRSPNLMNLLHEVTDGDRSPPENTDYDLDNLNLLKEDIERWMKDND